MGEGGQPDDGSYAHMADFGSVLLCAGCDSVV